MQKLAGVITEGQYRQKLNESTSKIGDKVKHDGKDYYVIQTSTDNDLDTEYPLFKKALTDNGATKDDFIIISKIEPEYGEDFSTKQIIDLLNSKLIKIIKATENVNEVATTPDFSKKITISKRADASRVNSTLKDMYPSGREDIDKRNLAKSIFEKVKASSDGLTVSEIAKELKVEESEVKDLMSELSSKSIFNIEKSFGRPTVNESEEDEDDIPLTKDVKRYIDGQIKDEKKLRKPEKLKKYLTSPAVLDNSLASLILLAFEDEYPDAIDVTDEVKKYILSQIPM